MVALLSPLVYWSQSKKNLFITISLKDVKGPTIKLEKKKLEFESTGAGTEGSQKYGFSLRFYSEINTEESNCKIQDGKIRLNIAKIKKCWWPRLTTKLQKLAWLRNDLDESKVDDLIHNNIKAEDISNRVQKEKFGYTKENFKKIYLIIYNLLMLIGYGYVTSTLLLRYLQDGSDSFSGTYEAVGTVIKYLHILQLSEILLVPTASRSEDFNIFVIQVLEQLLMIICLIDQQPKLQTQPVIFYLYLIWSASEIIRYLFNITENCVVEIFYITWLRYTVWIFSIPLGKAAEAITIHQSVPHLPNIDKFTYSLYNVYNFSLSASTFLHMFLFFIYMLVGFTSMSRMYQTRIKKMEFVHLNNN